MFTDTIKLGFGHNLVLGNTPKLVGSTGIANILEKESRATTEAFGLFESSSPNYTTYYPDVSSDDLNPTDDEFILPLFRALSEVIVHKNWNPIDFGVGGVLKKSMNLLVAQAVNVDHETMVGNAVGAVSNVAWQTAYKASNGVLVPAGINATLKIDGKSNPRLARGIQMDPPSIHSTSVTVNFMWEKSHNVPDEDFFSKLGSYDKDGAMYRRIVTGIKRYNEISLVGHGADPFAQKIDANGQIVNPTWADISYNSEDAKVKRQSQKVFFFDFKDMDSVSNSENTIPLENNNNDEENKNTSNMNPFLLFLAEKFGISIEGKTEEQLTAELKAKAETLGDVTALTATNATLTAENATLTARVAELEKTQPSADVTALTAFKTTVLADMRGNVTRLYNLTTKTPVKAITDMISNGDYPTLAALTVQYQELADQAYPAECKNCGSKEINRASTERNTEEEAPDTSNLSAYEIAQAIADEKRIKRAEGMHSAE